MRRSWWSEQGPETAGIAAIVATLIAMTCCPGPAPAAEPPTPCPLVVTEPTPVSAVVHYLHESEPGVLYRAIVNATVTRAPATITVAAEGSPVAVEWFVAGAVAGVCGTVPDRVFADGFESGDLSRWSNARR